MKGYKKIEELVGTELEDYSYFEDWELNFEEEFDNKEFYSVDVKTMDGRKKTLSFRYLIDYHKLEIEVSEDCYHEINYFSYNVKYLWIALLSWDI